MSKKPDIIVSIPTDPVATASAYKKAAAAGVKLVFMDNVPAGHDGRQGLRLGGLRRQLRQRRRLRAPDGQGAGRQGQDRHDLPRGRLLRHQAALPGLQGHHHQDYPDIKIVEEKGIAGPDFAGDAQSAANAMLSQAPDLAGIWAVWDVPAEGVMAAARASGRGDLKIATEDLGQERRDRAGQERTRRRPRRTGAVRPGRDRGQARLPAPLIGKKAPPYVALSALPVTHDNVLDAWKQVYHEDPPADLQTPSRQ